MSIASITGVAIVTAALFLVLSVFNGFEQLILSLYNSFDPPIKVSIVDGKVSDFQSATHYLEENNIMYSKVLEEKVLLRYKDSEYIAILKGVDSNFSKINKINSKIVSGEYLDFYDASNTAVIGQGLAYYLSMNLGDFYEPLQLYIPDRKKKNLLRPENSFIQENIRPVGIFAIQADFDTKYVLTKIDFVRGILKRDSLFSSSLEILCLDKDILKVKYDLESILGEGYDVDSKYEQHEFLYKILNSEKLVVFIILSLILIIATFNIVGALSMLIIEKKNDIKVLLYLGATPQLVRRIFFFEGILTTALGSFFGLVIGLLIAVLQIKFGLIKMGNGSFLIDSYPLVIKVSDIFKILLTVFIIGCLASLVPSRQLVKRFF